MNHQLLSNDKLTKQARFQGIKTWSKLLKHVQSIPYGRNSSRTDFGLVLSENRGTCSSKHALLKEIAELNNIPDVRLFIGVYKMNNLNTPKIGEELSSNGINYIPEAHCYLRIKGNPVDVTSKESDFQNIEKDLMQEIEIHPVQVVEFKVEYYSKFLKNWLSQSELPFDFDSLWEIREKCIKNLSNQGCSTI